jgi:amidase
VELTVTTSETRGATVDDETSEPAQVSAGDGLSRRAFARALGSAAVAGALVETVPVAARGAQTAPAPTGPPPAGPPPRADEVPFVSATELAARLRAKQISARDVMAAHLAQIARVNPKVNAIVTLVAERAMADAAAADEAIVRGGPRGALHGLPIAHKDLVNTAGIRTTFGSPFYRDHVPTADAPIVTRIRAAGAITLGKTNTPEFGAGSQTFNTVFGPTRNPYDLSKTCGGSSGGAAVALACGLMPIADGSDAGGSLRNPAAFCNVVGLRPSPGRVLKDSASWSPFSVSGPMARSVADVALFLSVLAGPDGGPLAIAEDGARFAAPLDGLPKGARVAWWKGLGGLPVEPAIRAVVDANRKVFEDLGCRVEDAEPDFAGVPEAFATLRYVGNYTQYAPLVRERPEWVKDTIRFEVAEAERLTGPEIGRALSRQARMYDESRRFFERFDYFVLPVTQVAPFDVDTPYPTRIGDVAMGNYIDWMRACWYITMMANPAMSVPAGFTPGGLPVGLQIVGRHRGEWSLLQMGHAFEQATRHGRRRPPVV